MKEISEKELKEVTGGGIDVVNNSSSNGAYAKLKPFEEKCAYGYVLINGVCEPTTQPQYDENGLFKR